jgi:ankyrin repeat protein
MQIPNSFLNLFEESSRNNEMYIGHDLLTCAERGQLDKVKYFVEQGADIHDNDDEALIMSIMHNKFDVVEYLIEHGANIHARDESALWLSVVFGNLRMVKYLVEHGADVHTDDENALDVSMQNGHLDVVEYINDIRNCNTY